MTNPQKDKGDKGEREVQGLLRELLGDATIRRALGAGRRDDVGDIFGVPDVAIQVANYTDLVRAVREKLPAVEVQRRNASVPFSAVFVRRSGRVGEGPRYVVVMTPEAWATYYREATSLGTLFDTGLPPMDDVGTQGYL